MKRLLAIMFLLVGTASAQNVAYLTNNVLALSGSSSPLVWYPEYPARVTVQALRGSTPVNLTNSTIQIVLSDRRDGLTAAASTGVILNSTNGYCTAMLNLSGLEPGQYLSTMSAIDEETGAKITDLSMNNITLTNWCDVCGSSGSASVTLIQTNIVNASSTSLVQFAEGAVAVTGNTFEVTAGDVVLTGATFNINNSTTYTGVVGVAVTTNDAPAGVTTNESGVATINIPPGGGGGDVTINGVTTNNWTFTGQYPLIVSNVGNMAYFGLSSFEGGAIFLPDLTTTVIVNYVSATNQSYIVPAGVTQLYVWAWGGGGGGGGGANGTGAFGGGGGYSFASIPVTPTEVLDLYIGGKGLLGPTSSTYAVTLGGFPDGGASVGRLAGRGGSGGGSTSIWRGTNALIVAGGGGGSGRGSSSAGGSGGGISGEDGGNDGIGGFGGGGGTQTSGGTTASTTISLFWTNVAGSAFSGGSAGATTNLIAAAAGGGGGGYFGGGGGLITSSANSGGGGGAGSGFINTSAGLQGYTIRAVDAIPAGQEIDLYQSGWGTGGVGLSNGSNGGMIIKY